MLVVLVVLVVLLPCLRCTACGCASRCGAQALHRRTSCHWCKIQQAQPTAAARLASCTQPLASPSRPPAQPLDASSIHRIGSHTRCPHTCYPRSQLKAGATDDEAQLAELQALDLALEGTVAEQSMQRSRLLIADAAARFSSGQEKLAQGKRIKVGRRPGCVAAALISRRHATLSPRLLHTGHHEPLQALP